MSTKTNYVGGIAAQLAAYRAKGHQEAAAHRPPTDAGHMDQHETAVKLEAEKWLLEEQRLFDTAMTEGSRAVAEIQQHTIELQTKIDHILSDKSLKGTIEADMAGERQALVATTEKRMRAEVEWRAFRAANNITEQAQYPDSHIWHFGIIAVVALIETVVNAFFYENAQGLLGGFTVALGVAVVNMAGALLLGIGFRFKNLSSVERKLFGWLCLTLFLLLAIYCNALFAAFRSEYQILTDPTNPLQLREAFAQAGVEAKRIFVLDMRIADVMSFVLFGLGLFLSGIAFWKGYTFDDKYAGYGQKDRVLKAARRVELEEQDRLRQKVKDFLHHRRSDVQSVTHEPAQLIGRVAKRIGEVQNAHSLLNSHAKAIQRDYALVLGAYRQANTSVRATEPPAYFNDLEDLSGRVSPAAAFGLIAELTNLQAEIRTRREGNQESLNEKLHALQGDASAILTSTFGEFLREIEAEAEDSINRMTLTIQRVI